MSSLQNFSPIDSGGISGFVIVNSEMMYAHNDMTPHGFIQHLNKQYNEKNNNPYEIHNA